MTPVIDFAVSVPNTATGDVDPDLISLSLGAGETSTETVAIEVPGGGTTTGGFADIVFVVDESGSMAGEQAWIQQMIFDLDTALEAEGIGPNQFGLVGYLASGRTINVGNDLLGTAEEFSIAAQSLRTSGGIEDGYNGLDLALDYPFRDGSAVNFILLTDEDRDNRNGNLTFTSLFDELTAAEALLNVGVNASFRTADNQVALGVDGETNAYQADGNGGFVASPGGIFQSGSGTTKQDYVDLAWAVEGAAWDLNQLRQGGITAQSFTEAFVEIKAQEVQEQLVVDVVAADSSLDFVNLTGELSGFLGGETATFDVQFTGDGLAGSSEIFFVRPDTGFVIGSIPVAINQDYLYLAQAVDPDGDAITYSLLTAPDGAVIDAATGRIDWTPPTTGFYQFDVVVEDSFGAQDIQSYEVEVVAAGGDNTAPTITSTAPDTARVGNTLTYQVTASDVENDSLTFFLAEAPEGVAIDADTGLLSWTPTGNQTGDQTVTVQVVDGRGGSATQSFGLTVSENQVPTISSTPIQVGDPAELYTYDVEASDPEGTAITYSLRDGAPDGLTIDPDTGLIQWTPTPAQTGQFPVTVFATDTDGGRTLQSFLLAIGTPNVGGGDNTAPTITSAAPDNARIDTSLTYPVMATDAENDPLTFSLLDAPDGATIDADTGFLAWTPTVDQIGDQTFAVRVVDGQGGFATQRFELTVNDEQAPTIASEPVLTGDPGELYVYDVGANDPAGVTITYSLQDDAPEGMVIDAETGLIQWTPTADQLGEFSITVFATNADGDKTRQSFVVTIGTAIPNESPEVLLGFSSNRVAIGEDLTLQVRATDDTAIASLELLVNGSLVTLTPGNLTSGAINEAVVQFTEAGLVEIVAIATDTNGSTDAQTLSVRVFDPSDTTGPVPQVDLTPFEETGAQITAPIDIIGTINDDGLEFYRLEIAPVDAVNPNNPSAADADYRVLAEGTGNVDGVIGQVDPTLLANGNYFLRVVTGDLSGNVDAQGAIVSVAGDLKPGRFTQEFVDLSVPVAGLPIEVTRVYDSLEANRSSDFGFGWSLGTQDAQIQESVPVTDQNFLSLFTATSFSVGDTVTLTNPEGRRVSFTFEPIVTSSIPFFGPIWSPRFVPEEGVFETLEVDNASLTVRPDGSVSTFLFPFPYNPSEYRLTTRDGTTYQYDQFEGLETVTDRNGNTLTYTDNGIFSSTGESVQFLRDGQERITEIVDPAGNSIEYGYDANGDLVTVTDRNDNITELVYEEPQLPHYLSDIIDPLGRGGIRNEYDEQGRLVRLIDADGNAVDVSFDSAASSQTVTDPLGNATTFVFDDRGNVVQQVDAEGGITLSTYDDDSNLTSITDPRGNTTAFTYDDQGNQLTETDALGNTTTFTYNELSQVLTTTDARGNVTTNRYDGQGNLIEVEDALGNITRGEYSENGDLTKVIDANGNETTNRYDSLGRLVEVEDAAGAISQLTYDDAGNLGTVTTPLGNSVTFGYDAEGRRTQITDPNGNVTQTEYNAAGDVIAEIDALGRRTEFIYNNRGLLTETRFADGTVTQTVYDELDRVAIEIDQNGNETRFNYDALGRLTSVVDALRNVTQYGYDASGNLATQTDALGRTTDFVYDAVNRLIEFELPQGQLTTNAYDEVGNLASVTDFNGSTITYEYDPNNQLSAVRLPNAPDELYTYTPTGQVDTITDARGVTQFNYDAVDQLIQRIEPDGRSIAYTYNLDGDVGSLTTASGTVNYAYNSLGLLETVTDQQGNLTTYSYDTVGNLVETELPNGIVETRDYDLLDRPTLIENTDSDGNVVASYDYTLDDTGNRVVLEENTGRRVEYTYDDLEQLTQETVTDPENGDETIDYVYNEVGNRVSRTSTTEGTTTYTYDENDRLLTETTNGVVTDYSYDDAGNLTTVSVDGEIQSTLTWNDKGELSQVVVNENGTEQTVEFQYNTDGIRVATIVDGETTNFLVDDVQQEFAQVVEEYDSTGNTDVIYTHGLDLISQQRDGDSFFYQTDALGSTRLITDILGNVANTYIYDAYGNTTQQTEVVENSYQFAGEQFDEELQDYYLRARYYDPSTGRFTSRDPFEGLPLLPITLNDYLYGGNNPANNTDPTGEIFVARALFIAAAVRVLLPRLIARVFAAAFNRVLGEALVLLSRLLAFRERNKALIKILRALIKILRKIIEAFGGF